MRNFLQPKEYDAHMYAKFGGLAFYSFVCLNTLKFDL
jgi:hypothetical protein